MKMLMFKLAGAGAGFTAGALGVVNVWPHFGHFTGLPAGTGVADFSTALQWLHWMENALPTSAASPGVTNAFWHLGHVTFFPGGTGVADFNAAVQWGQAIE